MSFLLGCVLLYVNILIHGIWSIYCLCNRAGCQPLHLLNFKLAWEYATLVILVQCKYSSNFILLQIDNQNLFLNENATIFVAVSGVKTDWPGNLLPHIHLNHIPWLIFVSCSIWKLIWEKLSLSSSQIGHWWTLYSLVTAYVILCQDNFLLGQKNRSIAKTCVYLGAFWEVAASVSLVAIISVVSMPQVGGWARLSTPARHFFLYTLLLLIGIRILCSMLFWALISKPLFCEYQILINIMSCNYVGLSGNSSL